MSALDEIRGRLQKANGELDRLTAGNPGTNWRWSIPANPERDSDLILADSIADVTRLLNAVEAVEKLHAGWEHDAPDPLILLLVKRTREAITAALEGKS